MGYAALFTPGVPDGGVLLETEVEERRSAFPGTQTQHRRRKEPIGPPQFQHRRIFRQGSKDRIPGHPLGFTGLKGNLIQGQTSSSPEV